MGMLLTTSADHGLIIEVGGAYVKPAALDSTMPRLSPDISLKQPPNGHEVAVAKRINLAFLDVFSAVMLP